MRYTDRVGGGLTYTGTPHSRTRVHGTSTPHSWTRVHGHERAGFTDT